MLVINYQITAHWSEEDQAFIGEAPDLPGCAADGRTHRGALQNAQEAIRHWIETATDMGREVPTSRRQCRSRVVPEAAGGRGSFRKPG